MFEELSAMDLHYARLYCSGLHTATAAHVNTRLRIGLRLA